MLKNKYNPMETRSSLELMLERMQKMEDRPEVEPPALPVRPVSKARVPPGRRSMPVNFQEVDHKMKSRRTKKEVLVESDYQQHLAESEKEFVMVAMSLPESIKECDLKEIGLLNNTREITQEGITGIQKCFRGHQARCRYHELKRGIITLQSFLRGEIARKNYQLLVERQTSVICLQCVIRGWMTRRNFNHTENMKKPIAENMKDMMAKQGWKNPKTEDDVEVPYSDLLDLKRRVLRAEAALGNKEEENIALKLQIEEFETKWQQYEAKMKSMEEMWQHQLTSIQVSLAAAHRNPAAETTAAQLGSFDPSPLHQYNNADSTILLSMVKFSDKRVDGRLNTIGHLMEQHEEEMNYESTIPNGPEDELQKLKFQFEAWKKDFKARLRETKTTLQKLRHSGMKKSHKRWWER